MPAINPARLKAQTAQLVENFGQPQRFVQAFHDLLEFYADRTYRPGQSGEPPPLLASYHVPAPVIRLALRAITPLAEQDALGAYALADTLWAEPNFEFRLVAAGLLGKIPAEPYEPLLERVKSWTNACHEERLLTTLVTSGLSRLMLENPRAYLEVMRAWLEDEEAHQKQLGLRAMLALLEDSNFENIPLLFRLLAPLARAGPGQLRPDLLAVMRALARRSPQETAFFLKENLAREANAGVAWLARNSLKHFPAESQDSLRRALRGIY